ncbi:MAG: hypothetical protein AB7K24_17165 [Gemmataceae bacterium]
MRRILLVLMAVLELGVAAALGHLASSLPSRAEVNQSFARAEKVTQRTSNQVGLFRRQLNELRRPELQILASQLEIETREMTTLLRDRTIDYDAVTTMRDALEDVSEGLDSVSKTLDPKSVQALAKGLRSTADFLDKQVGPAATKAAGELEELSAALASDAKNLSALVQQVPLDLKTARNVHDSLGKFAKGLETLEGNLELDRFKTMKQGFRGLETALDTGAAQVEKLASYSYPVVTFEGLRPVVEDKSFWPDGATIAKGMRQASEGAVAAGKELELMTAELPKLRESMGESRKLLLETQRALAVALEQQDKIEPLLKQVPERIGKLAEEMPKVTGNLARMLRQTGDLDEVAKALRQADQELAGVTARWPDLQKTLAHSARLLRATSGQLDDAIKNRKQYEAAVHQSIVLAEALGTLLPTLSRQLDSEVRDQALALEELEQSVDEFSGVIPHYASTTAQMVQTGRWLLWLVAAMAALHGLYLVHAASREPALLHQ